MADFTASWLTMAFLAAPLAYYSERRYQGLPELPDQAIDRPLPSLSIIVPARNEAANLRRLLPTLTNLVYPGEIELIVVDDSSTDQTALIAQSFGAQVVHLDGLPSGWSGKTHACHQGALAAKGEWLLFTDADTFHQPHGAAQAVAYARTNQLDGLSIFFKQVTSGGLDGLALSVAFAGLFVSLGSKNSFINGQYILLSRATYNDSGGFSLVTGESMEDLALGHLLSDSGYRVPLLRSDHVASVQMYRDNSSLWQGLMRIGAGSMRWLGVRSIITALFITGVMTPILTLISTVKQRKNRRLALFSWALIVFSFIPWASRFGSAWLALLAPLGALFVQVASILGLIQRLFGRGTPWKGRRV